MTHKTKIVVGDAVRGTYYRHRETSKYVKREEYMAIIIDGVDVGDRDIKVTIDTLHGLPHHVFIDRAYPLYETYVVSKNGEHIIGHDKGTLAS
jgi:hypothetical protein